jgi:hypothetical protein
MNNPFVVGVILLLVITYICIVISYFATGATWSYRVMISGLIFGFIFAGLLGAVKGSTVLLVVLMVTVIIIGKNSWWLSDYQTMEAIIGTALFIFLLGYMRNTILHKSDSIHVAVIGGILFLVWYFSTKLSTNLLNNVGVVNNDNTNIEWD